MKGQIFTTDAIVAAGILMTIIVISTLYIQDAYPSRWDDVVAARTAYDIGIGLDKAGALSSNNDTLIVSLLNASKPSNMNVSLQVERYMFVSGNLTLLSQKTYGDSVSDNYMTQSVVSRDKYGGLYLSNVGVSLK